MLPSAFDVSDALAVDAVAGSADDDEPSPKTDHRPLAMLTMSEPPPPPPDELLVWLAMAETGDVCCDGAGIC